MRLKLCLFLWSLVLLVPSVLAYDPFLADAVSELTNFLTSDLDVKAGRVRRSAPGNADEADKDSLLRLFTRAIGEVANDTLTSLRKVHFIDEPADASAFSKRSRRSDYRTMLGTGEDKLVYRMQAVEPLFATCAQPLHVTTGEYKGSPIAVCISAATKTTAAKVTVGVMSISTNSFDPRVVLEAKVPKMTAAFEFGNSFHVLTADSERSDGVDMASIDQHFGVNKDHTIHSQYPTAIAVWKPRAEATWHLAIANSPDPQRRLTSFKEETNLFQWESTYFDRYATIPSYLVRDICPFTIHNRDYLVIVNHQAAPNNYNVDTVVYRYDLEERKWLSVQGIRTHGAVDCEFFTLGTEKRSDYYLAIANQFQMMAGKKPNYDVKTVVYKFSDDKFIPFQTLKTSAAIQVKSYKGNDGEFVLAVADRTGVKMYQYNGWHFIHSPAEDTSNSLAPGVSGLTAGFVGTQPVLIVSNPSKDREANVFRLLFRKENLLNEWHNKSLGWCKDTKRRTAAYSLTDLDNAFKGTFYRNQKNPIRINGDLIFKNTLSVTGTLSTPRLVDIESNTVFDHKMIIKMQDFHQRLESLEQKANHATLLLKSALRLNGDQVITAPYTFVEVDFTCRHENGCKFGSINANRLNERNVSRLVQDVLRTDLDLEVKGNYRFQNVVVSQDLRVHGLVDGINSSSLVTRTGNHLIEAPQHFTSTVTCDNVNVNGLINGLVINSSTVLLTSTDQEIESKVVFSDRIITKNLLIIGDVNGFELNKMLPKLVTSDGKHAIRGTKKFQTVVADGHLHLLPGAKINGLDIVDLWQNMLWTYGDQQVVAPFNFSSLKVHGELIVDGLINGMKVPDAQMVLVNRSSIITAPKVFESSTRIDHMKIKHSINGLGLINQGFNEWPDQLNILVKSRGQTVFAPKTFAGLHLGGHSTVAGTVDSVKLSEFKRLAVLRNESKAMPGLWEINGDVRFEGSVTLGGLLNGVNLTTLYQDTVKLTDQVIPNLAAFHFNSQVTAPSIKCSTVNGLNLQRDLMTKHTRQLITGQKTFTSGVHVKRDFTVLGKVNGLDTRFMNDSLLRNGNQLVIGPKVIEGDLHVNNLIVLNLNGVDMKDLVLVNSSEQVITGRKTFERVLVNNKLQVKRLEVGQEINGVQVDDLFGNTMLYDVPQKVTGTKKVISLTIPKGSNLDTKRLNGYNLRQVYDNAVLIDVPQVINGTKTFKGNIIFDSLRFYKKFDGVSDHDMKNNWMLQGVDQVIHGDLIFERGLVVNGNLNVESNLVNGLDVVSLNRSIVKVNEPTLIEGQITFDGLVKSTGDIRLGGKIQGIKLSQEAVTKHANAQIFGGKRFKKTVIVNNTLVVNGLLDNVLISDLCKKTVRRGSNQVITAPTRVTGNFSVVTLTSGGRVDGVDLTSYNKSCVRLDESSRVRGVKHFKTLVIAAPAELQGKLGGIDVNKFAVEYMSLTKDQVIHTPIVFANGLTLRGNLQVTGDVVTKDGLINNIHLKSLEANSLRTSDDQVLSSTLIFENDVHFRKNLYINHSSGINGISLNDILVKGRPENVFTTPVTFDAPVTVDGDLNIHEKRTIDHIDVNELAKAMVSISGGNYNIDNLKHFTTVEVDHLVLNGTINGVEFTDRNLLLADRDQVINGRVVFNHGLRAAANVNVASINNGNINQLAARLVLKGYNNTITSPKSFTGTFLTSQATAYGSVDGINFTRIKESVYEPFDLQRIEDQISFQQKKLDKFDVVLRHQATCLEHYEIVRDFNRSALLPSSKLFASKYFYTTTAAGPCRNVQVLHQNGNNHNIVATFGSSNPTALVDFRLAEKRFLIVANSRPTNREQLEACVERSDSQRNGPIIAHGKGSTLAQILVEDPKTTRFVPSSFLAMEPASDLKIVEVTETSACVVFAVPFVQNGSGVNPYFPQVMCMHVNGDPATHWLTSSQGADKIAILKSKYHKITIMATINSWEMSESAFQVNLYKWESVDHKFGNKLQFIHAYHPTAVHLVETVKEGSFTYLFVAEGEASHLSNRPLLRIYRYNVGFKFPFMEVQQIREDQVTAIDSTLMPDRSLIVFILTKDSTLKLYKLRGASGFTIFDTVVTRGANRFMAFPQVDQFNYVEGHYIIMSNPSDNNDKARTVLLNSKISSKIVH